MGDPKHAKKKYQTPSHPWIRQAIEEERTLVNEYGLQKKKEIHIANSFLKKYKDRAKKLIADQTQQGAKEKQQMFSKLQKYGLLKEAAKLDDVLGLQLRDILNRRLETIVHKKGLSRSVRQARQFIVHGHVFVGKRQVTSPSYLVSLAEEEAMGFLATSTLAQADHPERVPLQSKARPAPVPAASGERGRGQGYRREYRRGRREENRSQPKASGERKPEKNEMAGEQKTPGLQTAGEKSL